jgi:hypothetical protein
MDKFNGATGNSAHKETYVIAGNSIQWVMLDGTTYAGTFTTSGNTLTVMLTCPVTMSIPMPYTATATQIQTINYDDPNEMHTITKQ